MNNTVFFRNEWEKDNINGTSSQIEAIRSEKKLTVVSAGAGTGKTQTLSQRFAWLLAQDPDCKVDEILVLTYTEKAAREMQERIKKTLLSWHEKSSSNLPHFKQRIQYIDDAHISTIHSFAMKVIRESGLLLDIDPGASITTAPSEDLWWKTFSESLAALSNEKLLQILNDKEWQERCEELFNNEFFSEFVSFYTPKKLTKMAKDASEKFGSYGKTPDEIWNQDNCALIEDVNSQKKIFVEIWNLWQEEVFSDVFVREELINNPLSFENLKNIMLDYSEAEFSSVCLETFAKQILYSGLAKLPGNSKLKDAIGRIISSIENKNLKTWRDEAKVKVLMASMPSNSEIALLSLLNKTAAIGWQCWESLRKKEGILTHNDLIRYASDVLNKNKKYGEKFKHILVDEFQDTDRLQEDMLQALWKDMGSTLFIVGDIKQSIYRFRHADLSIFQKYIREAKCGNAPNSLYVTLDKSFRTHDLLLNKINSIFESLWPAKKDVTCPFEYEPLVGAEGDAIWWERRNQNPINPTLEILLGIEAREPYFNKKGEEKWGKNENIKEMRTRCFKELAVRIKEMINSKTQIWDKEIKEDNKFRDVTWKDFAVLVPSRTVYSEIECAFDEIEVPYRICTSKDYFARGEVADIINLISLLTQPEDPYLLAGWLASPFSGVEPKVAEDTLFAAYRLKVKREPIRLSDVVKEKLPEVWKELMRLKAIADLEGVVDLIHEIIKVPHYLKAFEPRMRNRVTANIVALADLANEYESVQGRSLVGLSDYLQYASVNAGQKEEPTVLDEEHDAVQIMTIHASKGLEFPIVALVGIENDVKKVSGISLSLKYGILSPVIPDFLFYEDENFGNKNTVSGIWHSEIENKMESEEQERLWYVATTRAREKLILCGTLTCESSDNKISEPKDNSFLSHLFKVAKIEIPQRETDENKTLDLAHSKLDFCNVSWLTIDNSTKKLTARRVEKQIKAKALELREEDTATLARFSASAYAMLSWCPTAYRLAYRQGKEMLWVNKSEDGVGGADFGSLTHWFLSRWDFDKNSINVLVPDEDESVFNNTLKKIPLDLQPEFKLSSSRKKIRELLFKFAESDEGENLKILNNSKDGLKRETPFRVYDKELVMVGSIDIFWERDNSIHIRDWKTTKENIAPTEYYDAQLDFYAFAIWKYRIEKNMFKNNDIVVGINYLTNDNVRVRVLDEDKLHAIGENVHLLSKLALSHRYDRALTRCSVCPWSEECEM